MQGCALPSKQASLQNSSGHASLDTNTHTHTQQGLDKDDTENLNIYGRMCKTIIALKNVSTNNTHKHALFKKKND